MKKRTGSEVTLDGQAHWNSGPRRQNLPPQLLFNRKALRGTGDFTTSSSLTGQLSNAGENGADANLR